VICHANLLKEFNISQKELKIIDLSQKHCLKSEAQTREMNILRIFEKAIFLHWKIINLHKANTSSFCPYIC